MSKKRQGNEISASRQSKTLLKLLLAADNKSGHMGSGGHEVNKKGKLKDGTIVLFIKNYDCDPHRIIPVFIKGRSIFANQLPDIVINILRNNEISFFFNANAVLPKAINVYLNKKIG